MNLGFWLPTRGKAGCVTDPNDKGGGREIWFCGAGPLSGFVSRRTPDWRTILRQSWQARCGAPRWTLFHLFLQRFQALCFRPRNTSRSGRTARSDNCRAHACSIAPAFIGGEARCCQVSEDSEGAAITGDGLLSESPWRETSAGRMGEAAVRRSDTGRVPASAGPRWPTGAML